MELEKYKEFNDDYFTFFISRKIIYILKKIDNDISREILSLYNKKGKTKETFIDITDKSDIISYIQSSKINQIIKNKENTHISDLWNITDKSEMRIGRFIFKLFGEKFNNKEIEDFVNKFKSIIRFKTLKRNFKLVDGENLKKWYLSDNYSEGGGNLQNSCMRFRYCQSFLNFYSKNSDKVKLLILLDENKIKILGRSLVWKLDKPKNFFMDKIYSSDDFISNMFVNYAIKNGWIYKGNDYELDIVIKNKEKFKTTMIVQLGEFDYDYFPFLDNLCYYDPKTYLLSNNPKYFQKLGSQYYYDLCDHTGGYDVYDMNNKRIK